MVKIISTIFIILSLYNLYLQPFNEGEIETVIFGLVWWDKFLHNEMHSIIIPPLVGIISTLFIQKPTLPRISLYNNSFLEYEYMQHYPQTQFETLNFTNFDYLLVRLPDYLFFLCSLFIIYKFLGKMTILGLILYKNNLIQANGVQILCFLIILQMYYLYKHCNDLTFKRCFILICILFISIVSFGLFGFILSMIGWIAVIVGYERYHNIRFKGYSIKIIKNIIFAVMINVIIMIIFFYKDLISIFNFNILKYLINNQLCEIQTTLYCNSWYYKYQFLTQEELIIPMLCLLYYLLKKYTTIIHLISSIFSIFITIFYFFYVDDNNIYMYSVDFCYRIILLIFITRPTQIDNRI